MHRICGICKSNEGTRFCVAVDNYICIECCKESIKYYRDECFEPCEYLKSGEEYVLAHEVSEAVESNFPNLDDHTFMEPKNISFKFIAHIELFFVKTFYFSNKFNDSHIYEALSKIYLYRIKKLTHLKLKIIVKNEFLLNIKVY